MIAAYLGSGVGLNISSRRSPVSEESGIPARDLIMFFDDWYSILRIVILGSTSYIALILMLRTSGKRTLSKMNGFDLIVTVALGSALSTVTLSSDISFTEGFTAIALLITLQLILTWLSVKFSSVRSLVQNQPALVFHNGKEICQVMRRERVTRDDLLQVLRSQGVSELTSVHAIVLETDGTFSVLKQDEKGGQDATLKNVSA